ncbi:MAG: hypothetical protein NXH87_08990 [Rhodobiaceae bacterium]|nr:hypothetical protein [Rhodobiaceae bacterium]
MALQDPSLKRDQLYAWDQWVVWYLGGRPWPASFLIAGILLVSYWIFAFSFGIYSEVGVNELATRNNFVEGEADATQLLFGLGPYGWAATVFCLLGGFAGTVASYNLVAQRNEAADAAAMLGLSEEELLGFWDAHYRENRVGARVAGIVGYLLGVMALFPSLPGMMERIGLEGTYGFLPPASLQFAAVWFFAVAPLTFSVIAKAVYIAFREGQLWSGFRTQVAAPDIFDIGKLRPVTKAAMRGSFSWVIGATIGTLFFLSNEIDRSTLAPFFIGIGGVAVLYLVAPLVGWHRVLLAEKERQLRDVRKVIDRCWTRLKSAEDDDVALVKIGGLLALEARIQAAREWPIDFSTLGRLAFYLAIPLISWIGGALMERAVDAAIG